LQSKAQIFFEFVIDHYHQWACRTKGTKDSLQPQYTWSTFIPWRHFITLTHELAIHGLLG